MKEKPLKVNGRRVKIRAASLDTKEFDLAYADISTAVNEKFGTKSNHNENTTANATNSER